MTDRSQVDKEKVREELRQQLRQFLEYNPEEEYLLERGYRKEDISTPTVRERIEEMRARVDAHSNQYGEQEFARKVELLNEGLIDLAKYAEIPDPSAFSKQHEALHWHLRKVEKFRVALDTGQNHLRQVGSTGGRPIGSKGKSKRATRNVIDQALDDYEVTHNSLPSWDVFVSEIRYGHIGHDSDLRIESAYVDGDEVERVIWAECRNGVLLSSFRKAFRKEIEERKGDWDD